MLGLFLFFLFASFQKNYACDVIIPEPFSLFTSTQERLFFPYAPSGAYRASPSFSALNCEKTAASKKFLMIAFGPQNLEFTDRVLSYDFTNNYKDRACKITNSPFKLDFGYVFRKEKLQEKWHTIKSCYEILITEEADTPLSIPVNQPGCDYERIGTNQMTFNGGLCFVKPNADSSYRISFKLKDECLNYEGLNKLNIKTSDFQATLNFYTAGDDSGSSVDLTALKSYPVRLSVSPEEKLLKPSEIFDGMTPQFPSSYYLPDTHLGSPEARQSAGGKVQLRIPFWVENSCLKKCLNTDCQGLCDYSQPVVGNVEYYEIKDSQSILLTNWYQGGVAHPFYQGEIAGANAILSEDMFKIGSTYRVRVNFNDPKFDYENLKKQIQSKIPRIEQSIGTIGSSTIRPIPPIGTLPSTVQLPAFERLPDITFDYNVHEPLDRALDVLSNYLRFKVWPPYFEETCSKKSCLPIKDNYLTLEMDFKVIAMDTETKLYEIQVHRIARTSELLENYVKLNPELPKVICPY